MAAVWKRWQNFKIVDEPALLKLLDSIGVIGLGITHPTHLTDSRGNAIAMGLAISNVKNIGFCETLIKGSFRMAAWT